MFLIILNSPKFLEIYYPLTTLFTAQPHFSIPQALESLGLGHHQEQRIETSHVQPLCHHLHFAPAVSQSTFRGHKGALCSLIEKVSNEGHSRQTWQQLQRSKVVPPGISTQARLHQFVVSTVQYFLLFCKSIICWTTQQKINTKKVAEVLSIPSGGRSTLLQVSDKNST